MTPHYSEANLVNILDLKDINPYTFPAGAELDEIIHRRIFGKKSIEGGLPKYSLDPEESARLRARLKSMYGHPIVFGRTRIPGRTYFARYDSDPSTATEVVAATEPLATCRLALLLIRRSE